MTRFVPILMYHSIADERPGDYARWVVTSDRFASHLSVIRDKGFTPLAVRDFVEARMLGKALPEKIVVITFDDGLHDFLTGAMPVLSRFSTPATLFVTTGHVGGTARWLGPLGQGERPMCNWQDLRDIADAGIELGAHTISHPELDILPRGRAVEEIAGSRKALEDGIGRPVRSFAYPHGYSSATTRGIVRDAGFSSACRVRHAFSSMRENLFHLSRIIVEEHMDEAWMGHILAGEGLPVAPAASRPAAFGWRQARRVMTMVSMR